MLINPDVDRHMADFQDVADPYQEYIEYMIYDFLKLSIGLKVRVLLHLISITIFSR